MLAWGRIAAQVHTSNGMPISAHYHEQHTDTVSQSMLYRVLLWFRNFRWRSVSVGILGKNLGFRFGLGFFGESVANLMSTAAQFNIHNSNGWQLHKSNTPQKQKKQ